LVSLAFRFAEHIPRFLWSRPLSPSPSRRHANSFCITSRIRVLPSKSCSPPFFLFKSTSSLLPSPPRQMFLSVTDFLEERRQAFRSVAVSGSLLPVEQALFFFCRVLRDRAFPTCSPGGVKKDRGSSACASSPVTSFFPEISTSSFLPLQLDVRDGGPILRPPAQALPPARNSLPFAP